MPKITLDGAVKDFHSPCVGGADLYELAGADPRTEYLGLDREGKLDVPIMPDDLIVLGEGMAVYKAAKATMSTVENPAVRVAPEVMFNGQEVSADLLSVVKHTGAQILEMMGANTDVNELYVDFPGRPDKHVGHDVTLVLTDGLSLMSVPVLEKCARIDLSPPLSKKYKIKVDKEEFLVLQRKISGEGILALVNKTDDQWLLNRKFCDGNRIPIKAKDLVDLTERGVERFETHPCEAHYGDDMLQEITLPSDDVNFLDNRFRFRWETRSDPSVIIVRGYKLPYGYSEKQVDLMLNLPPNYPGINFDMFFLSPAVTYRSGREPKATAPTSIHGQKWQQWSRHYDRSKATQNVNVANHILFTEKVLKREVGELQ